MIGVIITALIFINIALLVLCGILTWLWRDQRKTIDILAKGLVEVLKDVPDTERRRQWLRAIDSGDASALSPRPPGPHG